MVFPSSRCLTCKKRRVKCDFAQPSCGQCHKASRVCIWGPYSEPGLHFRSENAFAQGKPRRPRKLRNGTDNNSRNLIRCSVLSRTLSLPVEHYALHYWIKTFTKWPDDLLDISLEYGAYAIYNWDSLRPDSSLHSAVMSFSLAMFGQVQRSSEIVESSRKYYSQSCTHIRRDIQDLSDKTIDQLLMATMLLDTYDNVIPREWVRSPSNSSHYVGKKAGHHRGTAALLLARKQRGYHQHTPLDVALRRPVIRAYIVGGVAVDKWLEDEELHNSEDPKLKLDMLMISVTSLRSRFKSLSRDFSYGITTDATIVNNLLIEAGSLDAALAAWSHNLSGQWNFAAHTINRLNQAELDRFCYNGRNDSYTTHGHAVMWNRYRAIRVIMCN
ncbi:hypothetical protein BGW36DRAFT_453183 [Talaromyces proteolyticus]|uniref:Zn(2)-C6 fungal-type domain-containing protein n=1 Tax=Talaromyces proteolyticus TaxID=1131652 RepID=A0AAD4KRB3_9EURO|nr:uncharacterized protein BGW36DRAFT_453183 [Talaromyces proteolyticus]KAH8695286.1 hypothetical protein BGW36DRAFT_453183 [Talaromyces proteolyticus]